MPETFTLPRSETPFVNIKTGFVNKEWYNFLSNLFGATTDLEGEIVGIAPVRTGSIIDFGGTSVPTGYLECDGSAVSRTTYSSLFAIIGSTWGSGDGSTTFTLPSFARRTTVGRGGTSTSTLGNSVGNTGGNETHTLITSEIPAHTHTGSTSSDGAHTHEENGDQGGGGAETRVGLLNNTDGLNTPSGSTTSSNGAHTHSFTSDATGGDGAHNNMPPSAVVMKIIKT